jgi:hypothetical protein
MKKSNIVTINEEELSIRILYFNIKVLGMALGLVIGLAIFIATNWLIIKGGNPIGPNLTLLSQFFIGYRVTFWGSIVGFAYGFAIGSLSGSLIGWIYNTIVRYRNPPKNYRAR